jgi:hypothetical protein
MIRKILVVTAALAMPVAALSATVTTVASSGVAGATTPPPVTTSCTVAGGVTFATPGLSAGGTLTSKSTVDTAATTTASGTGCTNAPSNLKIVSTTTPCPQTGGVPNSGDPSACLASTTKNGVVTYAIAKDPNYYDTTGSYAGSGLTDLEAALAAKPIKATVDSIAADLAFGSATEVFPTADGGTGQCGTTDVGFDVLGNVQVKGADVATYEELACLSDDSGPGTTGNFLDDLLGSSAVIQSATIGGDSLLTVTWPTTSCTVAGAVTFATPGLSAGGTLTSKSTVDTASTTTASGTGCPGTPNNLKIVSTTTPCPQTSGVPNSGDPSACLASTTKNGVVTYAIAKDPNYYDTSGSYAGSGLTDLEAALAAKPIKATVDSISADLVFGSATQVFPTADGGTGQCGTTDVGFDVQGNVQVKGATVATYEELACLSDDSGPGTTGNFLDDLLGSSAVIQTATIGGDSTLTVTF